MFRPLSSLKCQPATPLFPESLLGVTLRGEVEQWMVFVGSRRYSTMTRLGSRYRTQQQHPARNETWYLATTSSTFPM